MNTEVELEDVSNSKKDGENDACAASTIDNPGGGSGDAIVDSNTNSDNRIKEQQPVLIDNTKSTEALPPEKKVINIEIHQIESTKADDQYPVIDSEVLDEELLLNSDDETNEVDKKEIDDAVRNIEGTSLDKSDEKATKITIPTSEDDPDSNFELIFDTEEKPKDDPGSDFELVYDRIQMPTEASPADDNLKIIDQEPGNIDATVETTQSEPNEQSKEYDTKLSEQKPEESTLVINSNNDTGTHANNPGSMNEPESNDNQTELSGAHSENTKNIEHNKEIAAKTNVDTVAHEVRRSISLDWEDDDQQMQTDQSLSDDALKQLDAELGISDNINDMPTIPVIEPVEDSEEIIPSYDSKVDIPIVNSKEISFEITEMVERNLQNMSKNIPDDNAICNKKIKTNVPDSIHDDSDALKIPDISLGDADIKAETVDNTSLMDVDIAEINSKQEMAIVIKTDTNAMEVDETSKISLDTPKENTDKCEDNIASGEKSIEAIAKLSEISELPTGFKETITEDLTKDVQSTRKLTSSDNNTIGIKTDHKIKRPDVMIDIPTQELIDCDDEESSENFKSNDNECDRYSLTSKTVTEIVNHLAASKSPEKTGTLKEHQDTAEDQKEETGKEDEELQPTEEEKSTKNAESSKNVIANKPQDNIDKPKNIEDKAASNESQKTVIEPDDKKASEKKQEQTSIPIEIDVQPETSKPEDEKVSDATKTTPEEPNKTSEVIKTDDSEEAEDTDTLGLLAESSRVCDDDEEQEDIDGDAEYDDDVDPDDESSNPMTTAEHSEDSNTPETEPQDTQASPDEERNFIKVSGGKDTEAIGETDKADDTNVDMVPGNEDDATSLVSDSNDANDLNAEAMDSTDITIEENEPIVAKTTENETEDKEEDPNSLTVTEKLEEILNKSVNLDKSSKTRRRSILLELLSKIDNEDEALEAKIAKPSKVKKLEITPTKQVVYVDLDCDAEEDVKKDTKEVEEEASCDVTKVTDDSKTPPKDEADKAADSKNEEGGKEAKDDDIVKEEEIVNVAEILNLDSDEEVIAEEISIVKNNSCINNNCTSDESVQYYKADKASISYYCGAKRRGALICQCCLEFVETRNKGLIAGIKDMRDLMDLEMEGPGQLLVEISDSDSDDGQDSPDDEPIGEDDAKLLEDQLGELINSSWIKYKMDERVKEAEDYLQKELEKIQKQSKELDEILKDCEKTTDKIRTDFYATFEPNKHELPALNIHDTPIASYFCMEKDDHFNDKIGPIRQYKRQATTAIDTPAKKQALPANKDAGVDQVKQDEDKDVSVVRLSAESAPLELPPPGEMTRAPLKLNMSVYAMKNSFGAWLPGKVIEITPQATGFTQCRIRFEHNMRNPCKVLPARCIAYTYPSDVRMTIGTRVVALFKNTDSSETKKESYYSGVVAEIPNPVNNYRYLVFFDDGYAQYVSHQHTRLVAESSAQVWEEVHPFSRDFVYNYLLKYPERPMVRMHKGQTISVELNGKWYETRVVRVDASLVQVLFIEEKRTEWIYRGSTRLRPLFVEFQAAKGGARTRLPRSTRNNAKTNMPYVEYTRSDEQANKNTTQEGPQQTEELRRLRAVAKKSTGPTPVTAPVSTDGATSRVVYYTPKHCIRPHKLTTHTCGPRCRRTDVLSLAELRTYNPLAKPLLSGWERQITRVKGHRAVMYRAPCGRRVRSMPELHRYLAALRSDLMYIYVHRQITRVKGHRAVMYRAPCGRRVRSMPELHRYLAALRSDLMYIYVHRQITRVKGHRAVMYRAPCGRRVRSMPELHRYLAALRSDLMYIYVHRQITRVKGHRAVMYRAPCGRRVRSMPELHRYLAALRSDLMYIYVHRQITRVKGHRAVMYRAPCGRRVRSMPELHRYLAALRSDLMYIYVHRQITRVKGHRAVMYRAPCGRRVRSMPELHRYLAALRSDLMYIYVHRQITRVKGHRAVMYRAPCGRRVRSMPELHRYLAALRSDLMYIYVHRQITRVKGHRAVMYRAPCGRRVRSMPELHRYLAALRSDLMYIYVHRQITRVKGHRAVMYRAPCGRRVRSMPELHRYLAALRSDLMYIYVHRQITRVKGHRAVMYRAPCGRRVRSMPELHRYLAALRSDLMYIYVHRQITRVKGHRAVMYRAPCGRRVRSMPELHRYLAALRSDLMYIYVHRQITRVKGHRAVMYRAPCGRRVRSMPELHRYLTALRSDLAVDLFDFNPLTHCLAEFVLTKYNVGKKDLSHGKENVPVACVNYYDTSLPEFCSYNTERTPTAGVPLNLDPEFLCGCDCTDDCADKAKCACWQMTLEGARTIGMEGPNIGYQYRRLLEPLPTGIYECNSRCKCKNTCLNRVAQHPLQLKLQVFKTMNRGWGIRALNDVPKGCFLCIYAGNLLTDATANLDGLNEGDEYLAELDYIEVVEAMKEGYEEDVVDPETKTDKKDSKASDSGSESDAGESEEEERANKSDKEDDDFQPGSIGLGLTEFSKRLRQRDKKKTNDDSTEDKDGKAKEDNQDKDKDKDKRDGDCITISDDEEVREPARFTAQEGMGDKKFVSKYKSIRDYFGKDEACYIMDAKVQGNIGRYLNHSCSPNVFVQNVFVDTHDPRFPWVSFFALHHIKAGTELTWNYNYDVGSVPGKVLYCFCGAYNCRGRLL